MLPTLYQTFLGPWIPLFLARLYDQPCNQNCKANASTSSFVIGAFLSTLLLETSKALLSYKILEYYII